MKTFKKKYEGIPSHFTVIVILMVWLSHNLEVLRSGSTERLNNQK